MLYVLNACGGSLDYIKFYKLLYFAQQMHLVRYGRGIFRDSFYARERGPVPGLVYNIVKKAEHKGDANEDLLSIVKSIRVSDDGYRKFVAAAESPDMDELSASDIKCLDESISRYSRLSSARLSEITHADSAYITAVERAKEDPEQNKLSLLEIAKSGGASTAMLEYIRYRIEMDQALPR